MTIDSMLAWWGDHSKHAGHEQVEQQTGHVRCSVCEQCAGGC